MKMKNNIVKNIILLSKRRNSHVGWMDNFTTTCSYIIVSYNFMVSSGSL